MAERRYPEIYSFCERTERKGKQKMAWALYKGIVAGILSALLTWALIGAAASLLGSKRFIDPEAARGIAAVICALMAWWFGSGVYRRTYAEGLRMVIEAQRQLILIDTEHNTRHAAELLQELRPASVPQPVTTNAN